ncbi:hypothetical protein ATE68_01885 [Sphingopyxis sp. H038]|uniref:hypothetical protein n=1 Tax=unclassified Sphingopyxis TaxID=2614943 RepID=UPI0007309B14|nr:MULTISPECIES: hypothetical protein [unclassified Sphingopyxis]KTE04419.1 hypothetical protein ATE78_01885 [Sphingopyxis sp. H012]KTE08142.1 hypothetical protein ATE76_16380 [Sphingopyxis sp. H093]KTE13380.1 hypothetical protein ATE70_01540 [Sphingopyxis sp. H053]KTE31219.1 hypothetical protein ATE75_01515 [Sphingopyxis sp. H080]KTE36909.1 hypothetical protein ATE68_01885 [Sphingopyxis sp. H038]
MPPGCARHRERHVIFGQFWLNQVKESRSPNRSLDGSTGGGSVGIRGRHPVNCGADNFDGLVQAIAQAKREQDSAARRPAVDPADGWSPHAAMEFLASEDFFPPGYLWYFDRYRASVTYKFGDRPLANHATYYVEGDETRATLLTLDLWMWGQDNKESDEQRFAELIALLMHRAVGPDAVAAFREVLDEKDNGVALDWNGYRFCIESEEPGESGQFSVTFTIAHPQEPRVAADGEAPQ